MLSPSKTSTSTPFRRTFGGDSSSCRSLGETGSLNIYDVRLTGSSPADAETGLLGWVSCVLNARLRLDGLALRRTSDGHLTVSFPARRDATGKQHFYLRPLDDGARRDIEHQVFRALGLQGGQGR